MSEKESPRSERRDRRKLVRFAVVGFLNTGLDVGLLFVFLGLGLNLWFANALSTGISLVFSFFVNRSFTFESSGKALHQAIWFILVTLFGLWVLQPATMFLVLHAADAWLANPWLMLSAKGLATLVSMSWNYLLYNKLVFRSQQR